MLLHTPPPRSLGHITIDQHPLRAPSCSVHTRVLWTSKRDIPYIDYTADSSITVHAYTRTRTCTRTYFTVLLTETSHLWSPSGRYCGPKCNVLLDFRTLFRVGKSKAFLRRIAAFYNFSPHSQLYTCAECRRRNYIYIKGGYVSVLDYAAWRAIRCLKSG